MPTPRRYNQLRAILAITKASLLASIRNPSSVFFGILFPFIFIIIFGFIGNGAPTVEVGVDPRTNKDLQVYQALTKIPSLELITDRSEEEMVGELEKGQLAGVIVVQEAAGTSATQVQLRVSEASQNAPLLQSILEGLVDKINIQALDPGKMAVNFTVEKVAGREFKTIDFILPGQLGFALLSSGVFATAFVFINLKGTLVIKRFFATPVRRSSIVIGEGLARLVFAVVQSSIIIIVGTLFLGYTLIHGWITLLVMLGLSILGLLVFLGMGFLISSIAKDENGVPPLANIFTLPQFLLSGTFFSISLFPDWLQPVSRVLPLTFLNDAMRKVAFEGVGITEIGMEIGALVLWGIVIYAITIRTFKWE